MSETKPLHVQVAEALPHGGRRIWQAETVTDIHDEWGDFSQAEPGDWIEQRPHLSWYLVPRYDTDWSATGPLIEKLHISLSYGHDPDEPSWTAYVDNSDERYADTPLRAAARLILALSASGKLGETLGQEKP